MEPYEVETKHYKTEMETRTIQVPLLLLPYSRYRS